VFMKGVKCSTNTAGLHSKLAYHTHGGQSNSVHHRLSLLLVSPCWTRRTLMPGMIGPQALGGYGVQAMPAMAGTQVVDGFGSQAMPGVL